MYLSPHCFVGSIRRFTEKFEPVSHIRPTVDQADCLSRTQDPHRRHFATGEIVAERKPLLPPEVLNRQTDQGPEVVPALCEGSRFGVVVIHTEVSFLSFVNCRSPCRKAGALHVRRLCRNGNRTRREIAFLFALRQRQNLPAFPPRAPPRHFYPPHPPQPA